MLRRVTFSHYGMDAMPDIQQMVFQMYRKFCFTTIGLIFIHRGPADDKLAIIHAMAYHQTSNRSLAEPMITQLSDTLTCSEWKTDWV